LLDYQKNLEISSHELTSNSSDSNESQFDSVTESALDEDSETFEEERFNEEINQESVSNPIEEQKFHAKKFIETLRKTSNLFALENELKEKLSNVCMGNGFKITKNYGKKNDITLTYYCEFGGRKRDSQSQGQRKRKTKKIGNMN